MANFKHQFTVGKSIKDEKPETIFDRVIHECKKWTWEMVENPPKEKKHKPMEYLRPKLAPIECTGFRGVIL